MTWTSLNKREEHTWRSFRDRLLEYSETDALRRSQILFRGQCCSTYSLQTTLDRVFAFRDVSDRADTNVRLLDTFRRELMVVDEDAELEREALELLGRHHGLPSPLMDWTQSPYIASYFAFEGARPTSDFVSVWVFDRAAKSVSLPTIRIIDEPDLIRFNARALNQRGVFIRVEEDTRARPFEDQFSDAVFRFDISVKDRKNAIADLDEMRINATTLFPDFDGAARTSLARILSERPA